MSNSILVKNTRDPLAGLTAEDFERRLTLAVAARVREVWLFGSYTRGELVPDSDVDVILVAETQESFTNRSWQFADQPTDGFWKSVTATMRRLEPDNSIRSTITL